MTEARRSIASAPALLTYEEVLELHRKLTMVDTKLDRLIEVQQDITKLEARIRDLELALAANTGGRDVALWAFNAIQAIALVVVGWLSLHK